MAKAAPHFESFRNTRLSPDELDDLLLIALAIRQMADLNESGKPREKQRTFFGQVGKVYAIVEAEGWAVDHDAVDASVSRLLASDWICANLNPKPGEPAGPTARVLPLGFARAAAASRRRLNQPLGGFIRDNEHFEGMEQIQIDFLGEKLVIGCIEGEEDKAIERAHRFEVDCGELLKATSGDLDPFRAAVMGGILAHERIEELETGTSWIPASDRLVSIDHNSSDYQIAVTTLEHLISTVRQSNSYREAEPEDHGRRLAELEAGQKLLTSQRISASAIKATLWGTLVYLIEKFADAPIGEAATATWTALKHLLAPFF